MGLRCQTLGGLKALQIGGKMDNKSLLDRYTVLAMELQEEYLKHPQDFTKEHKLGAEYLDLREQILSRMG